MKATIKCYKTNATLFIDENFYNINWDGLDFKNEKEWSEWADEELAEAANAENYTDIKSVLRIHTEYLIINQ